MTDYVRQIERIESAQTLDEIRAIVRSFPAQTQREGGILYSGNVGKVPSEVIAKELARKTGLPLINDTPRAHFLANGEVEKTIHSATQRILTGEGVPPETAKRLGPDFLYGNSKAPPESPFSVRNSLWGDTSAEFTGSVRGRVVVVASAANAERVLAQVEVPTVLHVDQVDSLGGRPLSSLQALHTQGGIQAVLPEVQASFVDASAQGLFVEPRGSGFPITQVAISREAATALHLDGTKFVGAAALSEAGFVPAPIAPAHTAARTVDVPLLAESAAMDGSVARGAVASNLARGASTLGAVAVAYDATTTAAHVSDLRAQGNATGAQSDILHFGGRNLGALGGATLGAQVFGTAGAETGPFDLLIAGAGAIGGAIVGDKLADAYDRRRIYNQTDTQGIAWNYDPAQPQQGWTRTVVDAFAELGLSYPRVETAPPALAERLTFQASNTAVGLALAHPATPRDPYTQPPGSQDTPSRIGAAWTRDARTGQWLRTVTDQVMEHGLKSTHIEQAGPTRDAQLNAAAQQTLADNLAMSARGIAGRYRAAYVQRGWAQYGAMPEAVDHALKATTQTLLASDGCTYTRSAEGQWSTPGMLYGTNVAEDHVRAELDATERMMAPTAFKTAAEAGPPAMAASAHEATVFRVPAPAQPTPATVSQNAHAQPPASAEPGHARYDPRHPDNPNHALYQQLKERIPEASESRLLQFTAACHAHKIGGQNLGGIYLNGETGIIHFGSNGLMTHTASVNLKEPSPPPAQSIQHIQRYDQQQAQLQAHIAAQMQPQHAMVQQGPVLGGPMH